MKVIYSEFSKPIDGKPEVDTFTFGAGTKSPLSNFTDAFLPHLPGWIADACNRSYRMGYREFKFTVTIRR